MSTRTSLRRAAAFAIALVIVTGGASALAQTPAPSGSRLGDARARVDELAARISAGEARVESLKNRLNDLSRQVGREVVELDQIKAKVAATAERLEGTEQRLDGLRELMRKRARDVYMHGPTQLIDVVLGAKSFAELTGRLTYASAVAREDARLVDLVRRTKAELTDQHRAQERLEGAQRSQVASVQAQQATVRRTFADQVATVAELARERLEALKLVAQLEKELGASAVANLKRVAGHGMTISYGEWAASFLSALGAPASRNNLIAVVAWEAAEGTQATWNPLATTYAMPGATVFNSYNVRNYVSKEQGIEATILTLRRPGHGYEAIVSRLRSSAEPMETAKAINASDWCRGCAGGYYVIGFIPAVEQYYGKFAG